MSKLFLIVISGLLLFGSALTSVYSQLPPEPREWLELPTACVSVHDIGKLVLGVSNKGYFGNSTSSLYYKCINGVFHYSGSEYPPKSGINHLRQGSIWIGGIRGSDTLVTEGFFGGFWELLGAHNHPPLSELNPNEAPFGQLVERSSIKGSANFHKGAMSQQDLIAVYTDTIVTKENLNDWHPGYVDFLDLRLHSPLYIEVTQKSYAWSHEYSEDIVLFELNIRNIGEKTIKEFSFGISLEPAVGFKNEHNRYGTDDLVGFLKAISYNNTCGFRDTLSLVWLADNDGDPFNGSFTDQVVMYLDGVEYKSCRDAMGALYISIPEDPNIYFNWWTFNFSDFGPVARGNYRNFQTGFLGDPQGDRNKFFVMRNGETDYDPAFAKQIDRLNEFWLYPDQQWVAQYGQGGYPFNTLLSFQDGFITPGGSIPIVFAIVMAENFHTNPNNLQNLPDRPDRYYANLNFSDFARNAQIAKWIYDNPGIDTDGDGYAGEFRVCVIDSILDSDSIWIPAVAETTWYKGDGVPDWKPALPPPVPEIWVTPVFRGIHIRFNGQKSENSRDIFT